MWLLSWGGSEAFIIHPVSFLRTQGRQSELPATICNFSVAFGTSLSPDTVCVRVRGGYFLTQVLSCWVQNVTSLRPPP